MAKKKLQSNELLKQIIHLRGPILIVASFSAVVNLLMLGPSVYMLQVYDRVLSSRNEMTLLMLTILIVSICALVAFLEHIRSLILIRVSCAFDMALNKRIYSATFMQNLKTPGGHAGQALQDLSTIRQFFTGNTVFALFDAPWFPIYLLIIFIFEPALGVFATVGSALLVGLAWINERVTRTSLIRANKLFTSANNAASNNLRNAEVIESMGMLSNLMQRWFKAHTEFLQHQTHASHMASRVSSITKFVQISLQSLVLGFGALLVLENKITGGMMIASSILVSRALTPVQQLIGAWKSWSTVHAAYERLRELLDANPAEIPKMSLPRPQGIVSVEGLFSAPPGAREAVIKNLTFSLNAGDVLGIIGPSGSGKSTLARVLVGVWRSAAGTVRIDGADIGQWNKAELGPNIGYLPQDVELFTGTVSENIARFGMIDAGKVILAAEQAGVHEMILRLSEGYNTILGVNGAGLSGGQKQRIGLARAIYGSPSLIVLDEPNSNLDEIGENALSSALKEFRLKGTTVVMISHRRDILNSTDKLLVLRSGSIALFGPTAQVNKVLVELPTNSATKGFSHPDVSAEEIKKMAGLCEKSFRSQQRKEKSEGASTTMNTTTITMSAPLPTESA